MAALTRPTEANYEVHESVRVDTQDNEDHTFCGVMFPIKAKEDVPVSQIVINGVAVRGQLGPLTVWVSRVEESDHAVTEQRQQRNPRDDATPREYRFPLQPRHWEKVYEGTHAPSPREYQWLEFGVGAHPVVLFPGQVRALYIHSTAQGDQAIVYDNADVRPWHYGVRRRLHNNNHLATEPRYQDAYIRLLRGKAHLSPRPFGQTPIWGWGNAWRDHREFVGQISYGVRFRLWQPVLTTTVYGPRFAAAVRTLLGCQRRVTSPMALLPDECLYYILNMCRWDWFEDTTLALKERRRRQRRRARHRRQEEEEEAARGTRQQEIGQESSIANGTAAMETSENNEDAVQVNDVAMNDGQHDDDDDDDEDDDEDDWPIDLEEDSDSDESAWERQHGYRADTNVFTYHDVSSENDSDDADAGGEDARAAAVERRGWFRRHFARIHVLRALAQAEQDDVVMHVDGPHDSSSDDDDDGDDDETDDNEANYEPLEDTDEED